MKSRMHGTRKVFGEQLQGYTLQWTLQVRNVTVVLGNFSAHSNDCDTYDKLTNVFLPPSNASVLKPVDGPLENSLKWTYRRNLCAHILEKMQGALEM